MKKRASVKKKRKRCGKSFGHLNSNAGMQHKSPSYQP